MTHGTYSSYVNKKCRCDDCKRAARDYRASKKRSFATDDPRHGTPNGYFAFGCRCDPCKSAASESRNRGLPEGDERHGTVTGYTSWGCRCELCRRGIADYYRESGRGRSNALKANYGLTPEQWDALFSDQGGRCASCGEEPKEDAKRRFHVDHDHGTGTVRGILCHGCNVALGHLKEDQERIAGLSRYLAKWKPF